MKIILYKRDNSFLSRLVAFVTKSYYTHSAVLLKHRGQCYFSDSSLSKKGIIITKIADTPEYLKNRHYDIFEIKTNDLDFRAFNRAKELEGKNYDTTGAILWTFYKFFNITNKNFYCFEYTIELLKQYYNLEDFKNPNGDDLYNLASFYGKKTRFLNCGGSK